MPEMWTFSRIEGQTVPEGRVRRWRIIVAEWIFGAHGSAGSSEIGQVHIFTVPDLDLKCIQDCDATCGDLETVINVLVESQAPELRGPLLVIESILVKPKYRGRRLATLVAGEAFRWFDGLVKLARPGRDQETKVSGRCRPGGGETGILESSRRHLDSRNPLRVATCGPE